MFKKIVEILLALLVVAYVGYGIVCTIRHQDTPDNSDTCGSCWALTELFGEKQAAEAVPAQVPAQVPAGEQ